MEHISLTTTLHNTILSIPSPFSIINAATDIILYSVAIDTILNSTFAISCLEILDTTKRVITILTFISVLAALVAFGQVLIVSVYALISLYQIVTPTYQQILINASISEPISSFSLLFTSIKKYIAPEVQRLIKLANRYSYKYVSKELSISKYTEALNIIFSQIETASGEQPLIRFASIYCAKYGGKKLTTSEYTESLRMIFKIVNNDALLAQLNLFQAENYIFQSNEEAMLVIELYLYLESEGVVSKSKTYDAKRNAVAFMLKNADWNSCVLYFIELIERNAEICKAFIEIPVSIDDRDLPKYLEFIKVAILTLNEGDLLNRRLDYHNIARKIIQYTIYHSIDDITNSPIACFLEAIPKIESYFFSIIFSQTIDMNYKEYLVYIAKLKSIVTLYPHITKAHIKKIINILESGTLPWEDMLPLIVFSLPDEGHELFVYELFDFMQKKASLSIGKTL